MDLQKLTGDDYLQLSPGNTVYDGEKPHTIKRVHWGQKNFTGIVECTDGSIYTASMLYRPVTA